MTTRSLALFLTCLFMSLPACGADDSAETAGEETPIDGKADTTNRIAADARGRALGIWYYDVSQSSTGMTVVAHAQNRAEVATLSMTSSADARSGGLRLTRQGALVLRLDATLSSAQGLSVLEGNVQGAPMRIIARAGVVSSVERPPVHLGRADMDLLEVLGGVALALAPHGSFDYSCGQCIGKGAAFMLAGTGCVLGGVATWLSFSPAAAAGTSGVCAAAVDIGSSFVANCSGACRPGGGQSTRSCGQRVCPKL